MQAADAKRLQSRLGVTADGIIGRGTYTALFAKVATSQTGRARVPELALAANVHIAAAGISDTPLRLAHFMAQLLHESGGFRYMEEIASGQAYEGRGDLGNVQAGDGRRYKGRGPIQLTGRANYREFGRRIGIDLESHPQLAAFPSIGMLTACTYWSVHELNALADADDVRAITRRINGGFNGLGDRTSHLERMKELML